MGCELLIAAVCPQAMDVLELSGWRIDFDREATAAAYARAAMRATEPCSCSPCRNWAATRERFLPGELKPPVAQRLAEHAFAEKALRKRYGAAAAGLICAGLSLAFFSRSRPRRGNGRLAESADAVHSR